MNNIRFIPKQIYKQCLLKLVAKIRIKNNKNKHFGIILYISAIGICIYRYLTEEIYYLCIRCSKILKFLTFALSLLRRRGRTPVPHSRRRYVPRQFAFVHSGGLHSALRGRRRGRSDNKTYKRR